MANVTFITSDEPLRRHPLNDIVPRAAATKKRYFLCGYISAAARALGDEIHGGSDDKSIEKTTINFFSLFCMKKRDIPTVL
ncbi:hypothetical protein [Brenneria tiliae]|uniref:Uncharacterized protein n=1 Tax=Brenneria tiliae TaxID=2914984 RepID=A0ABT0MQT2_9GAMM|nr:hypothetical protein [Brenneria tiliae]MCL2892211.1 hypothetical protein [Brenneria tiliae]